MLDVLWKEEHWAREHPEVGRDPAFMADLLETKAEAQQGVADDASRGPDRRRKSARDVASTFAAHAADARKQAAELRASLTGNDPETPPSEP